MKIALLCFMLLNLCSCSYIKPIVDKLHVEDDTVIAEQGSR